MSFRFASAFASGLAAGCFGAVIGEGEHAPSWNIRPGQHARAIRRVPDSGLRSLDVLCWGLIPHHVKSGRHRHRLATIAAQHVASSRITGDAFRLRRCLVPATTLYEPGERPTAIESNDRTILALAAVWDRWTHPTTGELHDGFAIITNGPVGAHDQVTAPAPLIIHPDDWSYWLGERAGSVRPLLTAPSRETWRRWAVSRRVFSTDNDDPRLLLPFEQLHAGRTPASGEPATAAPQRPCC